MIKFIEHSEAKLKFVSYSITTLFSYLMVTSLVTLIIVYFAYFSPIESSLYCQKYWLNRIDCQLQERSLFNSQLTKIDIINLKQVIKHPSFGSRDSRTKLKAIPQYSAFNTIGVKKNYFFPSNPFSLVLFRYFNPFNWFEPANQSDIIDRFIKEEINQKSISIKKYFHLIDIIFPGLLIFLMAIIPYYIIVVICFTLSLESTYEFNHKTKRLIVKQKKLFGQRVERQYSFDQIKQVKLDLEYKTNFNQGRIILEFDPSYDYPIDEFARVELGTANFQIIKDFLEN